MRRVETSALRSKRIVSAIIHAAIIFAISSFQCSADDLPTKIQDSGTVLTTSADKGESLPDLFTGSFTYRIPIEVPPGRNGMQPRLALTYKSSNGKGWIGKGWELEIGSIERNTRFGVNYSGNSYIYRTSEGSSELVNIGGEYRSKIEKDFIRIRKLTSPIDGRPCWEATDKSGTRYLYGQTIYSRQNDPNNPDRIFKWCLDRVEDTNGNYMTTAYSKDKGQIYLRRIYYAGNVINGKLPTNYLDLGFTAGYDFSYSHLTNFSVQTVARLIYINIYANADMADDEELGGILVRRYTLAYDTSPTTGQYLLNSVQEVGKDARTILTEHKFDWWSKSGAKGLTLTNNPIFDSQGNNMSSLLNSRANSSFWPYEGDFTGDGRSDILATAVGTPGALIYANGANNWNVRSNIADAVPHPVRGDFNADGKMDFLYAGPTTIHVYFGTVAGTFTETNISNTAASWMNRYHSAGGQDNRYLEPTSIITGDFNGDGRTDILLKYDLLTTTPIFFSVGNGTFNVLNNTVRDAQNSDYSILINYPTTAVFPGDFNGDGKTDLLLVNKSFSTNPILFSNGNGTWTITNNAIPPGDSANSKAVPNDPNSRVITGDYDADGKTDIYVYQANDRYAYPIKDCESTMYFSLGDGTWASEPRVAVGYNEICFNPTQVIPGDFNGDGRTDFLLKNNDRYIRFAGDITPILFSRGDGTFDVTRDATSIINDPDSGAYSETSVLEGDFFGKGKTDIALYIKKSTALPTTPIFSESGIYPDLLTGITNSIGGKTKIEYKPSTTHQNTRLPFPVYTVRSIAKDDGNGNTSRSTFEYLGGYYHIGERDFRGFNYTRKTDPTGPNGVRLITETWFHQGNDIAVDTNNPNISIAYMKGKPYRTRVRDTQGKIYSEVKTTYASDADNAAPYFNPPIQIDSSLYEGGTVPRNTRTIYSYDGYGNVVRESQYGDLSNSSDDRTVIRTFSFNTAKWIVGLPAKEEIFEGIGTTVKASGKTFYYDDLVDCNSAPTSNQTPAKGNLTRVVNWLAGGASPERRTAYNSYGNPVCGRDAKGNVTRTGYDTSSTFPVAITNPLGHQSSVQYYGVNNVPADNGLYGQKKCDIDPNGAVTSYGYDIFGRRKIASRADGSWTTWSYNAFGTVGAQNVRTDTSAGTWSEDYFDGLGRTFKTRSSGPDTKIVVSRKLYDNRGFLVRSSLPYFEGVESPRYATFQYDPIGRVTLATNPDASREMSCYGSGLRVTIDPGNHRKRETSDVSGRLVKVEEYKGTYTACNTDQGSPYATTTYRYDVLGNLRFVKDAKGNQTEMRYDTLGRKTFMHDPDMGNWSYGYDGNGNLTTQTDAKSQIVRLVYDALDRPIRKDYPAGTDVTFTYDEASSTYGRGRLTAMADASGSTRYHYDALGRSVNTVKTIDGTILSTKTSYDNLDRVKSVTYPDNQTVSYLYDAGGNLSQVVGYAAFSNYNASGRARNVTFGNGVTTTYQYYPANNRVQSITTRTRSLTPLVNLSYTYFLNGNIKTVTDSMHSAPASVGASRTYSLYPGKAHAYGLSGRNFQYDANGNMISDGQRTITFDYDNMPKTINGSVSFVYDGNGTRAKKLTSTHKKIYIGKYYECDSGVCGKYIYAGDARIALKTATQTYYYHPDHLGSTSIVTDSTGNKVEDITYNPFGKINSDSGSVKVSHLYTGQELDAETGLYNYNARLYDSESGRFISADTIVQDPANPQSFNRYAYALNNPMRLFDPTGNYTEYRDDEGNWHAELDEITVRPNTGIEPAGFFASVTNSVADWFSSSDGFVQNDPVNAIDPLGLYDLWDFGEDTLGFAAGLGNAVTFGGSSWIAEQFMSNNDAAILQRTKRCSKAFKAGEWASLALGVGRMAYAGIAKGASMAYAARGATMANAAAASAFRNRLKKAFRLNPWSTYRVYPFANMVEKYGSAEAIINAAGRTNAGANAVGAAAAAGGATTLSLTNDCGCN